MTGSQLLQALASAIQAALPGWAVMAEPAFDLEDRQVVLALGTAQMAHYQYAAPAMEEQVLLRMAVRNTPGAYAELVDARDAVAQALFDLAATLLAQDVEFTPPGQWQPPRPDDSSRGGVFWVAEMAIPMRRRL